MNFRHYNIIFWMAIDLLLFYAKLEEILRYLGKNLAEVSEIM